MQLVCVSFKFILFSGEISHMSTHPVDTSARGQYVNTKENNDLSVSFQTYSGSVASKDHSSRKSRSRSQRKLGKHDSLRENLLKPSPSPPPGNGLGFRSYSALSSSFGPLGSLLSASDVFDSDSNSFPRAQSQLLMSSLSLSKKERNNSSQISANTLRRQQQRDIIQNRYHGLHARLVKRPSSSSESDGDHTHHRATSAHRHRSRTATRRRSPTNHRNGDAPYGSYVPPQPTSPSGKPGKTDNTRNTGISSFEAADSAAWGDAGALEALLDDTPKKRRHRKREKATSKHRQRTSTRVGSRLSGSDFGGSSSMCRASYLKTSLLSSSLLSTLSSSSEDEPHHATSMMSALPPSPSDSPVLTAAAGSHAAQGFAILDVAAVDASTGGRGEQSTWRHESVSSPWLQYSLFSQSSPALPTGTAARSSADAAESLPPPADSWAAVWSRIDRTFEVARAVTQILLALAFAYFVSSASAKEYRYQRTGMSAWKDMMLPEDVGDEGFEGLFLLSDTAQVHSVVENIVGLFYSGDGVERFVYTTSPVMCTVYRSSNMSEETDKGPEKVDPDEEEFKVYQIPDHIFPPNNSLRPTAPSSHPAPLAPLPSPWAAAPPATYKALRRPPHIRKTQSKCRDKRRCAGRGISRWKRSRRVFKPSRRVSARAVVGHGGTDPVKFASDSAYLSSRANVVRSYRGYVLSDEEENGLVSGVSSLFQNQKPLSASISSVFGSIFPSIATSSSSRINNTVLSAPSSAYPSSLTNTASREQTSISSVLHHTDSASSSEVDLQENALFSPSISTEEDAALSRKPPGDFAHSFPLTPDSLGPFEYAAVDPARFVAWLQLTNITQIDLTVNVEHLLFFETRYCMHWKLVVRMNYDRDTNHLWGEVEQHNGYVSLSYRLFYREFITDISLFYNSIILFS